jgi:prepilin-type N-terminal cleavage/methylation domain-containing protein
MKNEQGFSLIELLIVVAIIAIIAAIAIPSMLTAREAANESAGMEACRTIGSAEIAYASTNNQQYGQIADLYGGNFVDSRFAASGAVVGGYTYTDNVTITDPTSSQVVGGTAPALFGINAAHIAGMARWDFQIGADEVVRYGTTAPNGIKASSPIGATAAGGGGGS